MQVMFSTTSLRHAALLALLLALLFPLSVSAQSVSSTEVSISGSLMHFDYQEFSDYGKQLDREEGYLPGLALGMSQSYEQWLFAGNLDLHRGDTAYTGYTNSGIPINTTTRQNIAGLSLQAEYWLNSVQDGDFAVYFGAGYRQWERDILSTTTASGSPVSGLFETYTWWSGFAGIKTALFDAGYGRCLLDIRIAQTIAPAIQVNFHGNYDNAKLALAERWGGRLALPWRYAIDQSSSVLVEPYAEYHEFGRSSSAPLTSNGTVVGSVFEPASQTLVYGVQVAISQRF